MKDEGEVIRKVIVPMLKENYFVKTFQRIDRLHQKLKTEGALTPEEISIKHPFHPDVDVLYWSRGYVGEPIIYASEVKYFRLRKNTVYPAIYEGLGEALMLLTFGFDYVGLWHFFDPEIPSEIVTRYRDLTQNLLNFTNSPVNYGSWLLADFLKDEGFMKETMDKLRRGSFVMSATLGLKPNPLVNNWDTKIIRAIIKRGHRIVSK